MNPRTPLTLTIVTHGGNASAYDKVLKPWEEMRSAASSQEDAAAGWPAGPLPTDAHRVGPGGSIAAMFRVVMLAAATLMILPTCSQEFPGAEVEVGGACRYTSECKQHKGADCICLDSICTPQAEALAERKKKSVAQSLESTVVPSGETLAEGWFTRIRSADGKGLVVAQCANSEWLTGGSCSPTSGGDLHRVSMPRPGTDGSGRGGSWHCSVGNADVALAAHAICASERGSSAEREAPADAGTK